MSKTCNVTFSQQSINHMHVQACLHVCVHACMHACVCVCACMVYACACMHMQAFLSLFLQYLHLIFVSVCSYLWDGISHEDKGCQFEVHHPHMLHHSNWGNQLSHTQQATQSAWSDAATKHSVWYEVNVSLSLSLSLSLFLTHTHTHIHTCAHTHTRTHTHTHIHTHTHTHTPGNTFSKTHVSWGEKPTKQSDLPSPVFSSICFSRRGSQPQRCTHGYFPCMCSAQRCSLPCKITMQSCQSAPPHPVSHHHHILSVITTTSCQSSPPYPVSHHHIL